MNATDKPANPKPKPKLRTYPSVRISPEHLHFWHTSLMPHINHVLRGFYRKYPESVEISLESIGESSTRTKPTVLVICTSVNKVRSILKRNLVYDKSVYGLKVCKGKIIRARNQDGKRSMGRDQTLEAMNPTHQGRPVHGASIGAYVAEKHLPPVSLGGTILIDDQPYGMTVHHMLDDPSDVSDSEEQVEVAPRSSAMPSALQASHQAMQSGDELYSYPLSDDDDDSSAYVSDSETFSEFEEAEDEEAFHPGDKKGITLQDIAPEDYLVTQPALDDIARDFYPSDETRNEDHLDSFTLGSIHCSSGIRRRASSISGSVMHEIDWALFKYLPERLPVTPARPSASAVAKNHELPGMYVSSTGRTSGYKRGKIQHAMSIVKMAGRATPSASWTVVGGMGVPGDSGAWVVSESGPRRINDINDNKVAGTILAYSARKACAYICPMSVAIADIAETLGATKISFPGGGTAYNAAPTSIAAKRHSTVAVDARHQVSQLEKSIKLGMRMNALSFFDELEAQGSHEPDTWQPSPISRDGERFPSDGDVSAEEDEAEGASMSMSSLRTPFAPQMPVSVPYSERSVDRRYASHHPGSGSGSGSSNSTGEHWRTRSLHDSRTAKRHTKAPAGFGTAETTKSLAKAPAMSTMMMTTTPSPASLERSRNSPSPNQAGVARTASLVSSPSSSADRWRSQGLASRG